MMTYLTRLSFVSDGAFGSDVYDGIRRVGWVQPGSIGLCSLANEAAAIVAAALAYRELSRWFGRERAGDFPPSNGNKLAVTQTDHGEWIADGGVLIARLYRPKSHDGPGASTYAVGFATWDDVATVYAGCGSLTGAWRAVYAAVQAETGPAAPAIQETRDPQPLQPPLRGEPRSDESRDVEIAGSRRLEFVWPRRLSGASK